MTWDDAQRHCETQRSHLATFDTEQEYLDVSNALEGDSFWFGLRKIAGLWKWVDLQTVSYGKLPSESEGALRNSDCVHGKRFERWSATVCSEKMGYICEFLR
ncbi:unnamed protein product [Enterobius vermicularis]|uniref:C-type lectin domain-containing protein n=1 Tax=Enterobius vermicularis TaxID=51028 RepID=A0A0N4VLW8_ENTVE|nr:unnamed protein product [Enterobius vermicularis]